MIAARHLSSMESLEQRRLLAADISGVVTVGGTPAVGRTVYIDLNQNGVRNNNEPVTFTGTGGVYTFTGVTTGTYRVAVDVPNTIATSVPANRSVDVDSTNISDANFALTVVSEGPNDPDGSLAGATALGDLIATQTVRGAALGTDVDIYSFTVAGGTRVYFDLDGEGAHLLRIFNGAGQDLVAVPGGSDAYERTSYLFTQPGTYYVGVSAAGNRAYNATNGGNDTNVSQPVPLGDYTLRLSPNSAADRDVEDADFDDDEIPDLVVRNSTTGSTEIWLRDGNKIRSKIALTSVPGEWKVIASADFDGDGHNDILFRNSNTGASSVWLMRNGVLRGFRGLGASTAAAWRLVDATDFNGDDKADLLFHNTTTGQTLVQFLDGRVASGFKVLGTPSTDWTLGGASEFDSDGEGYLVWRNKTNGNNIAWKLDNLAITSYIPINARADQNWKMVSVNDFDDEGRDYDILWRNHTTGENQIWLFSDNNTRTVIDLPTVAGADIDLVS